MREKSATHLFAFWHADCYSNLRPRGARLSPPRPLCADTFFVQARQRGVAGSRREVGSGRRAPRMGEGARHPPQPQLSPTSVVIPGSLTKTPPHHARVAGPHPKTAAPILNPFGAEDWQTLPRVVPLARWLRSLQP